ncbi:putative outer membrane starch-binding protein [Dyadobacter jejuensis]|uniref:Putative outer membrane starch-binding protein n=1 Tax=Dyadobacter jejuensis TaxID=1082580 RepID=A0A316AI36_9BACT|nr:RagB/SusD family nutrient uptake outer membrane protein [Dyadobacter jejuensis]PWJ56909.1 putative outer membrane starch-binding protein [Dyadobacter jejuensis]
MKKIVILTLLFATGLFSCEEALNTQPSDFLSPQYYYNNETELSYALNGVYDMLGKTGMYNGGDGLTTTWDVADEMFTTASRGAQVYVYDAGDNVVNLIWRYMYTGIERANVLLDNLEKPEMSEEARDNIEGQARFLRAYYYFVLVQNYGAVPLRTLPTASVNDIAYPRVPADEVYDFIIQEMEAAEKLVPSILDQNMAGRISKSAVWGVLARVNLYKAGFPVNDVARYADALKWSKQVIDLGYHELNPSYEQFFINLIQNKYDTKESIWELEFFTTGAGEPYGETGGLGNNNGISQQDLDLGFSGAQYRVQKHLYDLYDSTDTRRDWAIAPFAYSKNFGPEKVYWLPTQIYNRNIGKWRREYELTANKIKNYNGTNFPLLRYADVLLMAAEAENEVNGPTILAYQWLNQVRERAQTTLYTDAEMVSSQGEFRKLIKDERSRELCFESWRKLDLIRWNILIPTMKTLAEEAYLMGGSFRGPATVAANNITQKHLLQPIPLRELSLNKMLTQNPEW